MSNHDDDRTRPGFSFGQIFFTFLTGGAIGAAAAALMAPRSGQETRAELKRVAEDSRERVGRLPGAIAVASEAAAAAFTEALEKSNAKPHPSRS